MIDIDRNKVLINNREIAFDYPILQMEKIDEIVLILLAIPPKITDMRNVYALDTLGNVLWKIGEIETVDSNRTAMRYIRLKDGKIWLFDFYGECYEVNKSNGELNKLTKDDVYSN